MLNRAVLVGRITRDIELRRIDGSDNSVTNFTIALDRKFGNDDTDFIPCTA
jgi:single-strand DNA-binding protein